MNTNIIYGCFYTENTPYFEVFESYFLPSAMKFNLQMRIYTRPNFGSWIRNVAEKPGVILEMLNSLDKDASLVFLDCDATIEKYPDLFEKIPKEYDIALHHLDWSTWYNRPDNKTKELLTGTMLFRNNEVVKKLLTEWYETAKMSDIWEQKILEKILPKYDLKIFELPIEYIYINSLPDGKPPHVKCDPVIVHHQASRKLKKIIRK